ncbi:MAG: hypothetical protein ACI9W4_001531 [Rhodothermales bacterium]|jgi:hypothetical protein
MARATLLIVFLGLITTPVRSQTADQCQPALAEAYLETYNVRARILNNGAFFYSGIQGQPNHYKVPKGGRADSQLLATLWLGGMTGTVLRTAGSTYGPYEFWSGPLSEDGRPGGDCSRFDRIWSVTRSEVEVYRRGGMAGRDLLDWPTGLGAPTLGAGGRPVDLSHLPLSERIDRVIQLEDGELPHMAGDHMLWWIMNDAGGLHRRFPESRIGGSLIPGTPIGVEVQATAFGFDSAGALGNTTFYRIRLAKPAGPALTEAYLGVHQDLEIGSDRDDYVGSDSILGLAYGYNADNFDEGVEGYGEAPPAAGLDYFQGPLVADDGLDNDEDGVVDEPDERLKMSVAVVSFNGSGVQGDSHNATELYHRLRGRWNDGTLQTWGGSGLGFSSIPAPMAYTGTPGEAWSEFDPGDDRANSPSARLITSATGPFTLSREHPQEILFGIVTSFGSDNLDSVRQLKQDDRFIQNLVDEGLLLPAAAPSQPGGREFELAASVYPVPAVGSATIAYSLPKTMSASIQVFDILGRRVATLAEGLLEAGAYRQTIDISRWAPGVYTAIVQLDYLVESRTILVID